MGRIDDALRKTTGKESKQPETNTEQAASFGQYGFPIADFTGPSSLAESYRTLRTNIQRQTRTKGAKIILIASASKGDGRTQTVANLAVVASAIEANQTLLIDADLRHPQIHDIFGIGKSPGLSNFLQGAVAQSEIVHPTQIGNLKIIPSGDAPQNPAELFHSPKLSELLQELKSQYDMIFLDSAPVIPFTDSVVLGTHVDAIVLVVRARQSRREVVGRAKDLLNKSEQKIVGVILNRIEYVMPQTLYRKL